MKKNRKKHRKIKIIESNSKLSFTNVEQRNKYKIILSTVTPAFTGAMGTALLVGAISTPTITIASSIIGAIITGSTAYKDIKNG